MEENVINIKPNWRHCLLENAIKKRDPSTDMTRSGIFHRALEAAHGVENWSEVAEALPKNKEPNVHILASMQFKYTDDDAKLLEKICKIMRADLVKNGIIREKLQTQYVIQLLFMNYIRKLDEDRLNVRSLLLDEKSVDIPELSRIFTKLILSDNEAAELSDIRDILVKWENKRILKENGYEETEES